MHLFTGIGLMSTEGSMERIKTVLRHSSTKDPLPGIRSLLCIMHGCLHTGNRWFVLFVAKQSII
jgi:hypothetical protein